MRFFHAIGFRDKKGITMVWLALFLLPLLLFFAGLAIDIAYMYNVKNQLQVAADAAALAGAALLSNESDTNQAAARTEAITFATKNFAAGELIQLADGGPGTNTLSNTNDITVGHWDFASRTYTGGTTPINAIQVRPRRTGGSPAGPVSVFFGQILRYANIGSNWSLMSADAEAIASKPPRATSFIDVGRTFCPTGCAYPASCPIGSDDYSAICVSSGNPYPCCTGLGTGTCLARVLQAEPTSIVGLPYSSKFGWTSLLLPPGSCSQFKNLMCNSAPSQDTCGQNIEGISGTCNDALRDFESLMYDPNFDAANKETNSSGNVIGWWTMFPQSDEDDPMFGPGPHTTTGYILAHVIAVCAPGGAGCKGYDLCDNWPHPSPPPDTVNGVVVIDQISCIGCDSGALGLKAALVK